MASDTIMYLFLILLSEYYSIFIKGESINNETSPSLPIKFCMTGDEFVHCLKYKPEKEIERIFACIKGNDQLDCIGKISNGLADIASIDISYGYEARIKKLQPIAFPSFDLTRSLVLVKSASQFKSMEDLKSQFGCFSLFANIDYMAFLVNLKKLGLVNEMDYDSIAIKFLSDSCIPGILSVPHESIGIEKLCTCSSVSDKTFRSCTTDEKENLYYGNLGALKCLNEIGAFAVITKDGVPNDKSLTVMCRNGSLASYPGLDVDENCYLAVTNSRELIIRDNTNHWNNILLSLSEMEKHFNMTLMNPLKAFIDVYNNTDFKNYLNHSTHLDQNYKYIESYLHITNLYKSSFTISSASSILVSVIVYLPFLLYLY